MDARYRNGISRCIAISWLVAGACPALLAATPPRPNPAAGASILAGGGPRVQATISPNPPVVGSNALDLLVSDPATGKPLTGLKLSATVAMRSMDMGTTRPAVKETGHGHYKATVAFNMKGPWRVTLKGGANATLDFQPGSPKKWTPAATAGSTPGATPASAAAMPAMPAPASASAAPAAPMAGMDVAASGRSAADNSPATPEAMDDLAQLPLKRLVTVTGNEDWAAQTGFGVNASAIAMMDEMMVGGSGMEHMKMGVMKMASMTMGSSGAAPAPAADDSLPVTVALTPNPPVVGDNTLDVAVTDKAGKPVTGLKLAATVAMATMDMGATHPLAKEGPAGHYVLPIHFAMAGPWRVTLRVAPPKAKPFTQSFNFQVPG